MKAEYNIKMNVILQPYKDSGAPTSLPTKMLKTVLDELHENVAACGTEDADIGI